MYCGGTVSLNEQTSDTGAAPAADAPKAKKKGRVIKASTLLQAKVGLGPLDQKVLRRCQDVMDNNKVDFTPLAREYLRKLEGAVKDTRDGLFNRNKAVQMMTEPVMQLKAHASMFKYTLIGTLANIMLSFLESIREIDDDVLEIVEAHHKTLKTIVSKKMEGDGGEHGKTLQDELNQACQRYHAKKK